MAIPDFQTVMLPVLRDLAQGERTGQETLGALAADRRRWGLRRKNMRRRVAIVLLLTSTIAAACSQDSTGATPNSAAAEPSPTPTTTPIDDRPDAPNSPPFQLSSLDERCGDQTATALLAHIQPEYGAILRNLHSYIDLPVTLPLTIRVVYGDGPLTCYPAQIPPPESTRASVLEQIGISSRVQFFTEGRAFQEEFSAELKGRGEGERGRIDFSGNLDVDALQGTYRPELPGYDRQFVAMSGWFWDEATGGAVLQGGQRPGHASEIGFVAVWATDDEP